MGYISTFKNVYKEIQLQKGFNKTFLLPYLDELERKYYGLFITSFLCSSYKRLYRQTLTGEERKRATLFGILTPVGDDLFDIDKLDVESIAAITFTPETYTATTFAAHVAKEIQTYLLGNVPHTDEYVQASEDVLKIQAETAKQTNKNISLQDLQRITYT